MSIGCWFSAGGVELDVDAFLADSSLEPDSVVYRGQITKLPGRPVEETGFSIIVSETEVFGDLAPQIPDAIQFLKDNRGELHRLSCFPNVTDLCLTFPYCPGDTAMRSEYFPSELLALAGSLRIGISLSVYPGRLEDDNTNPEPAGGGNRPPAP